METVDKTIFKELIYLKTLDLSNNHLVSLQDQLLNFTNLLEDVKLNNNSLESIDDNAFAELNLKSLDLSCNLLTKDNFLWPAVNIKYLNLTYNRYQEINTTVLENVETDLWGEQRL